MVEHILLSEVASSILTNYIFYVTVSNKPNVCRMASPLNLFAIGWSGYFSQALGSLAIGVSLQFGCLWSH